MQVSERIIVDISQHPKNADDYYKSGRTIYSLQGSPFLKRYIFEATEKENKHCDCKEEIKVGSIRDLATQQ
jgi:hypothetical protein